MVHNKECSEKGGLESQGIRTKSLRKGFRKVLNRGPIDEDTKEALTGHGLPGSRGNHFDYHDIEEVAKKYVMADFSLEGNEDVADALRREFEQRVKALENEIVRLRTELDRISKGMHIGSIC